MPPAEELKWDYKNIKVSLLRESDHPQSSWEIENCLHHVKDRGMGEDAQRCKRGASIWSRLRSIAVGLFAQIMGDSTPLKQILIAAKPSIALKMLKPRKFFKYAHR